MFSLKCPYEHNHQHEWGKSFTADCHYTKIWCMVVLNGYNLNVWVHM